MIAPQTTLTFGVNAYPKCKGFVANAGRKPRLGPGWAQVEAEVLRINRQTDYAVRVLLALVKEGEGARLSTSTIQREMRIPSSLMPRIVAQLARTGLLNTFAGRDGGLMLPRPAAEITLRDVVEAFEGPILLSQCLQANGEDDCPFRVDCPVRPKWGRVQISMLREMATISFADLAAETRGVLHISQELES